MLLGLLGSGSAGAPLLDDEAEDFGDGTSFSCATDAGMLMDISAGTKDDVLAVDDAVLVTADEVLPPSSPPPPSSKERL